MTTSRLFHGLTLGSLGVLMLAGCGTGGNESEAASTSEASASTVTVEDNHGSHEVEVPPTSVAATDNRVFETLDTWDVDLAAAPVPLIPDSVSYSSDEGIADMGSHREPNLESVVAAEPDVVINGQRFAQFYEDIKGLVPDATVLELDPRDGEPIDSELKRQTTVLGQVFDKNSEAEQLNADLDAAIERAKNAYKGQTTMGLITSGGDIGYVAPGSGRTIGPVFDILGLEPSLETEGSDNHQGDDISVEAIAESKPELVIVMDRDAAVQNAPEGTRPAAEILEDSEALKGVPAIENDNVVYLPEDTYTNEGIQTYTEFFNALADKLESQNS